jgi:hypothetical protein
MEPWNQRAHNIDSTKDPPRRNTAKNLKTVERHYPEYEQQNYDYSTSSLHVPCRSRLPGARVFQNVPLEERYIKLRVRSGDPLTVLGVLQNSGVERLSAFSCHTVCLLARMAQCDPTPEGLSQGFIFGVHITICRSIPLLVRTGEKNPHFTQKPTWGTI